MATVRAEYKAIAPASTRFFVYFRKIGVVLPRPSEDPLDRIPNADELTTDELESLRLIVERSFASKAVLPNARRARLVALGLIQNGMGGVMPTPAGRIVARR